MINLFDFLNPFAGLDLIFNAIEGVFTTFLPALNSGLDSVSSFIASVGDIAGYFPATIFGALIVCIGIRVVFNFF